MPIKLVAFDLDGTLVRRETVSVFLAGRVGQSVRAMEIEMLPDLSQLRPAVEEMALWYEYGRLAELCESLNDLPFAPGVEEGFGLLHAHGVDTAILSMTWEFAVAWIARRLNVTDWAGTRLLPNGQVDSFWPDDKAIWLRNKMDELGLDPSEVAVVGDSSGDLPMMELAGHAYFVGKTVPAAPSHLTHMPDGDIHEIARSIMGIAGPASELAAGGLGS